MSHYCPTHPRYAAKREPNSLCGKCFELWFLLNPEDWRNIDGLRVAVKAAKVAKVEEKQS